jgi:hypothetical protein
MPPSTAAAAKRSTGRRTSGTRVQRRVSGPAAPARAPRAATAPSIPRRRPAPAPSFGPFAQRALKTARTLRDSHAVDRLVRGRVWIGLLCVLLIGLVGLNVSLLKLNAAAGRNAEWAKKLRVENADLRARVSRLHSAAHIQAEGQRQGLVMPTAADVHYLTANPLSDARRAAKRQTFTPSWSDGDIVSATPEPTTITPIVPAVQTPAAPAAGETGVQGTTGATGAAAPTSNATPGTTGQAATGATGTQPLEQPGTGATVP